jgi:hypothetical protein
MLLPCHELGWCRRPAEKHAVAVSPECPPVVKVCIFGQRAAATPAPGDRRKTPVSGAPGCGCFSTREPIPVDTRAPRRHASTSHGFSRQDDRPPGRTNRHGEGIEMRNTALIASVVILPASSAMAEDLTFTISDSGGSGFLAEFGYDTQNGMFSSVSLTLSGTQSFSSGPPPFLDQLFELSSTANTILLFSEFNDEINGDDVLVDISGRFDGVFTNLSGDTIYDFDLTFEDPADFIDHQGVYGLSVDFLTVDRLAENRPTSPSTP